MLTFTAILLTVIGTIAILGLVLWLLDYVFTADHTLFDNDEHSIDQVCIMQHTLQAEYFANDAHLPERTKE